MAIFEKEQKDNAKNYLALLDSEGEMVAIINPMKGVSLELLQEALTTKGLNCEIKEPKSDRLDLKL